MIFHNDRTIALGEARLSPGQVGLMTGWGVFTTLRLFRGEPFAFERHWARMTRDAAALHVELPVDREAVRRKLSELIDANGALEATLRLVVVRNQGGLWEGPSSGRPSDLIALTADSKRWGSAVKLAYVPQARHAANAFAGAKVLSWAMNLTWLESVQAQGFDEAILLNERGEVAECTSANIFVARGSEVGTPPLSAGCLPGITREVLLGEIRAPGIRIAERTILPAELESADEVFITSTTRNLLPVVQVGERKVGQNDQARLALDSAFGDFVKRYVAGHRQTPAVR